MNCKQGSGAFALAAILLLAASAQPGHAQTNVKHIQTAASPLASAVWAGDTLYAAATAEISYTVARSATATVLTLGTGAVSAPRADRAW